MAGGAGKQASKAGSVKLGAGLLAVSGTLATKDLRVCGVYRIFPLALPVGLTTGTHSSEQLLTVQAANLEDS